MKQKPLGSRGLGQCFRAITVTRSPLASNPSLSKASSLPGHSGCSRMEWNTLSPNKRDSLLLAKLLYCQDIRVELPFRTCDGSLGIKSNTSPQNRVWQEPWKLSCCLLERAMPDVPAFSDFLVSRKLIHCFCLFALLQSVGCSCRRSNSDEKPS